MGVPLVVPSLQPGEHASQKRSQLATPQPTPPGGLRYEARNFLGVKLTANSDLHLLRCHFAHCVAYSTGEASGGAVSFVNDGQRKESLRPDDNSDATIVDSRYTYCRAVTEVGGIARGGALHSDGYILDLIGSTVEACTAEPATACAPTAYADEENRTESRGGGLYGESCCPNARALCGT